MGTRTVPIRSSPGDGFWCVYPMPLLFVDSLNMENSGRVVDILMTVGIIFIIVHERDCKDEGEILVVEGTGRVCVVLSGYVETFGRGKLI